MTPARYQICGITDLDSYFSVVSQLNKALLSQKSISSFDATRIDFGAGIVEITMDNPLEIEKKEYLRKEKIKIYRLE